MARLPNPTAPPQTGTCTTGWRTMKRSPLRPRSKRREREYRTSRRPLVAELLAGNPPCQRCGQRAASDVHEIKTRARGGSIHDRDNLAVLCRPCHTWVTEHPAQAREDGWVKNSWED